MLVVDDLLLFRVLASTAPGEVLAELEAGELFTTGGWYYRLTRAIHDHRSEGVLSREFNALDEGEQDDILAALDDLPDQIGLLGFRRLVPIMAVIDVGRPLNMLTAEVVASALLLSASVSVTTDSPPLRAAATELGLSYSVIE